MLLIMKGLAWQKETGVFVSGGLEAGLPSASRSSRQAGGDDEREEEEEDVEEDVIGRTKVRTARGPFRARAYQKFEREADEGRAAEDDGARSS